MSEMAPEVEALMAAKLAGTGNDTTDADDLVVDDSAGITPGASETETQTQTQTPEQEAAAAAAAEQERLYAGKYKSPEELEQAYASLEGKLGEQGQKLGEQSQRLEQLQTIVEQTQAPAYDRDRLEEWLDENIVHVPQLAEEARKRGDTALYDAALEKWYDVAPRQASQYERRIEMNQLRQEMSAQTTEQTAPAQALKQREAQQEAVTNLQGKFEDFADVMGGMDEAAIGELLADPLFPSELLATTNPGDVAGQEKLLGTLYAFAKTRQVGSISELASTAARTAQDDSRDAKRQGSLPTPSGSGTQETVPPDAAKQVKNAFRENFGLPALD